ncbi:MAG: ABC transporter permease [Actinomycetales bacterium]|nr:ABC transporter permease [Actinomycetales bacterium]
MSAQTAVRSDDASVSSTLRHVTVTSKKYPVVFTFMSVVLGLILLAAPREGETKFRFSAESDFFVIPSISVPAMRVAWVCLAILVLATITSWVLYARERRTPLVLGIVFAFAFLAGFLSWGGAGSVSDFPVVRLISASVLLAVPILFGALGGAIGERAGVVNIAIEGQLLASAFVAAVVGSITKNPWAGLVAALVAGALVALVLGAFTITYRVNQVIVGVVLNVLVLGLTSFMYTQVLMKNADQLNRTVRFPSLPIPLISEVPIIGPALFRQSIIVYLMYLAVPLVWFALYRTRWGLRLRAVGEHPLAADTVGIKVERTRYRALLIAGAVVGFGGAYYTLVSVSAFNRNMTAGAGFIALAAVIFGKWDPVRAALAALLFGFASALEGAMSVVGSPVPSQFMLMLPYVVTLFAVAGLVGRSRAPAASGIPYVKE